MKEIVIKKDIPTATCVWCGWLHLHCCCLCPFFPLSLPSFGVVIVVDVVIVVPVWPWHGVVWCMPTWFFFFFLKLFQPALNSSHDVGWNEHFLTSLCTTNHSCHHQHQRQMATITSISNTNARDDEGRGFKTQMSLEPPVFFFLSFYFYILLIIYRYTKDDNKDRLETQQCLKPQVC